VYTVQIKDLVILSMVYISMAQIQIQKAEVAAGQSRRLPWHVRLSRGSSWNPCWQ